MAINLPSLETILFWDDYTGQNVAYANVNYTEEQDLVKLYDSYGLPNRVIVRYIYGNYETKEVELK